MDKWIFILVVVPWCIAVYGVICGVKWRLQYRRRTGRREITSFRMVSDFSDWLPEEERGYKRGNKIALTGTVLFLVMVLIRILLEGVASAADPMFTSKQLSDLKATGRDIIVPKYLPEGFQIKKVSVDRTHPEVPSYDIWFVGPGDSCFVIRMGTEVGDVFVENKKGNLVEPTFTIKNPLLGETAFWNTREYLGTNWFSHKNTAYMIQGDWDRNEFSRDKEFDRCKRMPSAEFIKVAQSLVPFRK